ncbi:3-deoxy-7-phosphoheptulonate synthase, partial [Pseudomonas syringae pv. tagetis]
NSRNNPLRPPQVHVDVLHQPHSGKTSLIGMMIESHLFDGRQPLGETLQYGVSVTDGGLGGEGTERLLRRAVDRLRY